MHAYGSFVVLLGSFGVFFCIFEKLRKKLGNYIFFHIYTYSALPPTHCVCHSRLALTLVCLCPGTPPSSTSNLPRLPRGQKGDLVALMPDVTHMRELRDQTRFWEEEFCSEGGLGILDVWPETVHPRFFSKIRRFAGKLPPAGTLNAEGLFKIGGVDYVLSWAKEGFPFLWQRGPPRLFIGKNNPSVWQESVFIDERIADYLASGVASLISQSQVVCSLPLKVVVSGASGKKRLIWVGCYVNNFLPCPKFSYEKLETFVAKLQLFDTLGKVDCASGYHSIKIHKDFRKFLCF